MVAKMLFNKGWECMNQYRGLTYIYDVTASKRASPIASL